MQKSGNKGSGSFDKFREFSGSFDIFLEFIRSLRESSACFVFEGKKAARSHLASAPTPRPNNTEAYPTGKSESFLLPENITGYTGSHKWRLRAEGWHEFNKQISK